VAAIGDMLRPKLRLVPAKLRRIRHRLELKAAEVLFP
jgi:hypothetical protein